jgi:hypothetical protein
LIQDDQDIVKNIFKENQPDKVNKSIDEDLNSEEIARIERYVFKK